jgi:hypothetical protein
LGAVGVGALWAGVVVVAVVVAVAVGVVGAVVVARDGVGGPSLSLSLREEDEGRRRREANRLCLAAGVCCISTCRVFGDGRWETGGMAARCWCAGEFAGSCRVQRCSITKSI